MPFDKANAVDWIKENALPPFGNHKCASYVKQALEAGGGEHVRSSRKREDWGPTLNRLGFAAVGTLGYIPKLTRGDIGPFSVSGLVNTAWFARRRLLPRDCSYW